MMVSKQLIFNYFQCLLDKGCFRTVSVSLFTFKVAIRACSLPQAMILSLSLSNLGSREAVVPNLVIFLEVDLPLTRMDLEI